MTTKFDLHLIVPAKLVGTIVEIVESEGILVSMNPYKGDKTQKRHHIKREYAGGVRFKGSSGSELFLKFLQQSPNRFTNKQVEEFFSKYSFARGSATSRLSEAKQKGMVKAVSSGLYEKA